MGEPINVPLLDLSAQNQPLAAELKAAFARVLDSSQFILGPEVAGFESVAAESVGAKHAIGVSSGTDALLLSLMTLGIGPGDEVLCPSFTFFATAGAIARTGATRVATWRRWWPPPAPMFSTHPNSTPRALSAPPWR